MNKKLKTLLLNNYLPEDTNLLVKIYKGIRGTDPNILQRHLWDYSQSYIREQRAREILYLASKVVEEHDV